jgi:cell wall-associated NlpC family hydrolase
MSLLSRARNLAVAGVTSLALATPAVAASPAAAAPVPQLSSASAASTSSYVTAASKKRKSKSSRSKSFAVRAAKVMRTGNSLKGTPYRYGGSTPRGFDCSGFTMYVYRKAGVKLTHSATAQMRKARTISKKSVRKGDLVFFRSGSRAYHVGIYAGKGRVLHSPRPGTSVKVQKIWTKRVSYGRVL